MNTPLLPRRTLVAFAFAFLPAITLAVVILAGGWRHETDGVVASAREAETRDPITTLLAVVTLLGVANATLSARSLQRRVGAVAEACEKAAARTTAAVGHLGETGRAVAAGCAAQGSTVTETSASLEEMSAMIRSTADNASQAKDYAAQARSAAAAGSRTMADMNVAMRAIEKSSGEVATIVKNIDEIAFQTNILALNAAVEAARAGDVGAGFAVVADEVRSLAQRSAAAARETAERIDTAIARSREGSASCSRVAESLSDIAAKVTAADGLVAEIATAAREQAQGILEIGNAMARMDAATRETAAAAERLPKAVADVMAVVHSWHGGVPLDANADRSRGRLGDVAAAARPPIPRRVPARGSTRTPGPLIPMPGDPGTLHDAEERHFRDF